MKKTQLTVNDIKEFEIDLTGTCNLSCPLCTRNYKHAEHLLTSNIRSMKDIIKQLDIFPNLERIMVAGAISEPTLHPEFFKFVEYLNRRNIHIDMFTNGSVHNALYWSKLGKLFLLGHPKSSCTFTICGTSQEIHVLYRIGSSLSKILINSEAFRASSNRDILQIIKFNYNVDDVESSTMKIISNKFTSSYIVETEGQRRLNEYIKPHSINFNPLSPRLKAITSIFKFRKLPGSKSTILCKAFEKGKLHINQYGQMHYCYISMEFPESKNDFILPDPNLLNKDYVFDFSKVLSFTYPDCFLCEKNTRRLIEVSGLDFVC